MGSSTRCDTLLLVAVYCLVLHCCESISPIPHIRSTTLLNSPPNHDNQYQYETKYFTQPVDQFGFDRNDTYQMRYLINDTYWKEPDGPIFFYTGNEGDIEAFAQNSGMMWDIAPQYNALLLFAEHRYYGKSLPYGNKSLSDPMYAGFLTSEQALADFANFISAFKANLSSNSPVVAFGGSYGGMLAAWFRMKYPHIVKGAIACSAPIWQFPGMIPCNAFAQIVTNDFNVESKECTETIRKSWNVVTNKFSTDEGKKWLNTNWKLCEEVKTPDDLYTLKNWLMNIWTNLAMVDYPYEANFLEPLPAYPIKVVCSHMTNSSASDDELLMSMFGALNVYFNYTSNTQCLDITHDSTSEIDSVGWYFQSCSEMVMPFCYNGVHDFFEPSQWNYQAFSDECFKQWKIRPRSHMAQNVYGGRDITAASNIVFSNGLLDPWSSGGVLESLSDTLIAVVIPEGAHHMDLRAAQPHDPESVREARRIERQWISKWIQK